MAQCRHSRGPPTPSLSYSQPPGQLAVPAMGSCRMERGDTHLQLSWGLQLVSQPSCSSQWCPLCMVSLSPSVTREASLRGEGGEAAAGPDPTAVGMREARADGAQVTDLAGEGAGCSEDTAGE